MYVVHIRLKENETKAGICASQSLPASRKVICLPVRCSVINKSKSKKKTSPKIGAPERGKRTAGCAINRGKKPEIQDNGQERQAKPRGLKPK